MQEINDIKKSLDLGETINEAFEIWKKTALIGGLAFIFLMLILMTLAMVGIGYFFSKEELPELMKNFNPENVINQRIVNLFCHRYRNYSTYKSVYSWNAKNGS